LTRLYLPVEIDRGSKLSPILQFQIISFSAFAL
jgi:hypothetical protein